jgi:hypothetical protein
VNRLFFIFRSAFLFEGELHLRHVQFFGVRPEPLSKQYEWFDTCREKIRAQSHQDLIGYGFRDGEIFVLGRTDRYTLWWCDPKSTDPIPVPLQLSIDDTVMKEMKDRYDSATLTAIIAPTTSSVPDLNMAVTSKGLCLTGRIGGLWFIPYTAIDAYLKSQTNAKL